MICSLIRYCFSGRPLDASHLSSFRSVPPLHSLQKKPKDKPKRPLSAYNFFFKEEREKILKIVMAEDPFSEEIQKEKESDEYLDEEAIGRLKKEGGKVSFEEMGKLIGSRWKNIDPDRLGKFSELASEDTERYKEEMAAYNGRQEAKMRSEAMKPPASYSGPSAASLGGASSSAASYGMGAVAYGDMSAYASSMGMYGGAGGTGGGNPYGDMSSASAYASAMGSMYGAAGMGMPYGGGGGMYDASGAYNQAAAYSNMMGGGAGTAGMVVPYGATGGMGGPGAGYGPGYGSDQYGQAPPPSDQYPGGPASGAGYGGYPGQGGYQG